MVTLIQSEFTVGVPSQRAWDRLARLEQWPSCAPHIKQIEVHPPGPSGALTMHPSLSYEI
jgi:carbon monoxide dehydrogenase subunit G